MTLRMICDACQKVILDAAFHELVSGDGQRHYHDATCWPAIKQAIAAAEQSVRNSV